MRPSERNLLISYFIQQLNDVYTFMCENIFPAPALTTSVQSLMITEELCTQDSSLGRLQRPTTAILKLSSLMLLFFTSDIQDTAKISCYCHFTGDSVGFTTVASPGQTHDIHNNPCHRLGNDHLCRPPHPHTAG